MKVKGLAKHNQGHESCSIFVILNVLSNIEQQ